VTCTSDTNVGGWLVDGFTLTLHASCPTFQCPGWVCASAHLHADAIGLGSPGSFDLYGSFSL
jgi:hypothetical protein